jgi:DtxR family Mn-dependent transcriptional regulator
MERLSESLEMYLKAIYILAEENPAVHAKDIAWHLEVTRPSVTGALKQLGEKRLVNYSPYEAVSLTTKGKKLAKELVARYEVLRDFFTKVLGIEGDEAERVACEMEHAFPGPVMTRMIGFLDYMMDCPRGNVNWDDSEHRFFCNAKTEDLTDFGKCLERRKK